MRYALLVASREYGENARTKGFWLSLLMFPVLLYAGFEVPALLEKRATPTRYFALVDESGEFGTVVERDIESRYERQKAAAVQQAFFLANVAVSLLFLGTALVEVFLVGAPTP